MAALIVGTLVVDQRGCLQLAPATEGPLATLLWPAGTYGRHQGRELVVLSSMGEIVAKTGEQFSAGGGTAPHSSTAATACGPESFSIMDAGPYND